MKNLRDTLMFECQRHHAAVGRMAIPYGIEAVVVRKAGMRPVIIVDESVTDPNKINELIAHELGHLQCGTGNNFTARPVIAAANEALADRRAVHLYMSLPRLLHAVLAGCREPWEFAEMLEITEDGVTQGLRLLAAELGEGVAYCQGYAMSFVPELRVVPLAVFDSLPVEAAQLAPYTTWSE